MINLRDDHLYQAQSESHNEVGTKEVRAHVVNLADYLIRVPGVALGNIQEEAQVILTKYSGGCLCTTLVTACVQ